ncbi:hypothetical protein GF327_05180 [Candidatus Woesearchaeota archaeon]|nr:hypothetical protein [Candidatus Woesearchaeota archaeon]
MLSIKTKKTELQKIAKKYNLLVLVLFGSRADNTYSKDSDFDFAFYTKKPMKTEKEISLYEDLVKILETEKIDIININTNHSPIVRKEIFFMGKPIYEVKNGFFDDLKWAAWFDYIDFQKYEVKRRKILEKQLEEAAADA